MKQNLIPLFQDARFQIDALAENPLIGKLSFDPAFLSDNGVKRKTGVFYPNGLIYREILEVIVRDLSARLPRYQGLDFQIVDVRYYSTFACVLVEYQSATTETTLNNAFEPVEEVKQVIKRDLLVCALDRVTRQYSYTIKSIFDVTYKGDKLFNKGKWKPSMVKAFLTDNSLLDENPKAFKFAKNLLPALSSLKEQKTEIKSKLETDIAKVERNIQHALDDLDNEWAAYQEQETESVLLRLKKKVIAASKSALKLKKAHAIQMLKVETKAKLDALKTSRTKQHETDETASD